MAAKSLVLLAFSSMKVNSLATVVCINILIYYNFC